MRIFPEFIFIERPMLNLFSEYVAIKILFLYQPLKIISISYEIPALISVIFYIFIIVGLYMIIKSVIDTRQENDNLGIEFLKDLLNNNSTYLTFSERYGGSKSLNHLH